MCSVGVGLVAVASQLPGDMTHITGDAPGTGRVLAGVRSHGRRRLAWGGSKSFFSGEGLLLLRCSGHGDLLIASYGAIRDYTLKHRSGIDGRIGALVTPFGHQ
jgi:uncharacterized protein (AIM24 family)